MLLRNSKFKGISSFDNLLKLAKTAKGEDPYGYRSEFINLVEICKLLKNTKKDENAIQTLAGLRSPRLLKKMLPKYPNQIKRNNQANVVLDVTTDIYGRVVKVTVVTGHPLLRQAAVNAVSQWIYEPYIENGIPKPVKFTVSVPF